MFEPILNVLFVVVMVCAYDLVCFMCVPDDFRDKFMYTWPTSGFVLYIKFKFYEWRHGEWK